MDMSIYADEIFGLVLSVVRASSYEAVELVNSNRYGNGTAIFANDGGGATRRFQNEIDVGMVGVNLGLPQNT